MTAKKGRRGFLKTVLGTAAAAGATALAAAVAPASAVTLPEPTPGPPCPDFGPGARGKARDPGPLDDLYCMYEAMARETTRVVQKQYERDLFSRFGG